MSKPMSVQLYSVRQAASADFPGTLERIAAMGFVGVEFAGLHGMSAQEVATVLQRLGMVASSAHVGLPTDENIDGIVADSTALGYRHIATGSGAQSMTTLAETVALAARYEQAAQLAASRGLALGYHNHWWEFSTQFDGVSAWEILMNKAPSLNAQLDIYWSTLAGADTAAVLARYASRIPTLHIKDGDLVEGQATHKAAGQGKVDIPAAVNAANPDVLEWLVVELDNCETDMLTAVSQSLQYMVKSGMGEGRQA